MILEKMPALQQMSVEDKLSLVSEIWEELEGIGEKLPVSDEQKRILDERFARNGEDPDPGSSWPEVKERLLGGLGE